MASLDAERLSQACPGSWEPEGRLSEKTKPPSLRETARSLETTLSKIQYNPACDRGGFPSYRKQLKISHLRKTDSLSKGRRIQDTLSADRNI